MQNSEAQLNSAMRRIQRWWLVPLVLVLVLAGLGAAYWAGISSAAGEESPQATQETVPVSAAVERRAVTKQVILSGKVVAGAQSAIKATAGVGIARLVVTSTAKSAGDELVPGQLVAVVSGRPLLVLPSGVPLFRDISPGQSGPDVKGLQEALTAFGFAAPATGTFDAGTQLALSSWYRAAGSKAPTAAADGTGGEAPSTSGVIFRWQEFVQVPGDAGTIASIAQPGTVLGEEGIVANVTIAEDTIVARADVLQAESFPVGAPVTVHAGSATLDTKVSGISAFIPGAPDSSDIPGKDVTLPLVPGTAGLAPGQTVTVTATADAPTSLAVPLIAIRQESGTAFVDVESGSDVRRVDVTVTGQADGWAAIADGSDVAVGDHVRLP
ncbi:peptidoglycan-binding domain-containing protein [Paenarthrobacter nitroguajacolicus]|uniref:peptidoglycan-binding domain-containing protein n=1 Tax=Paenarthrobacter nitroguajacolicus TaxID=211146 RepID=UPI00248BD68A|nr:peptidoglycan-binding domain-containing protein [Paenarthrobacter nitroguajacolicus]MDI2033866.1 hypothetical protein [Paenarthrobacter nitroguajacolicus]